MKFRIFISSPGDVGKERELTREVIKRVSNMMRHQAELEEYVWELEPMLAHGDFQDNIKNPADFDLVVCLLWSRLGTPLPEKYIRTDGSRYLSGTEYEFEQAQSARDAKRREAEEKALIDILDLRPDLMVYRRTSKPFIPLDASDYKERKEQWERVGVFVKNWFENPKDQTLAVAFKPYDTLDEFEERLQSDLIRYIQTKLKSGDQPLAPVIAPSTLWTGEGPYVGEAPFEIKQSQIFQGRLRAIDEVLNQIQERWEKDKLAFLCITGGSGTGKSSLLHAGVLAWMVRPGIIRGVAVWRHALLSFTKKEDVADPYLALAKAVFSSTALPELASELTVEKFTELLRQPGQSLKEQPDKIIASALLRVAFQIQQSKGLVKLPETRVILAVDQMELLSAHAPSFADALHMLACSGVVWIVATARSDTVHALRKAAPALFAGSAVYLLPPPTDAEISLMIRRPAELAGITFEQNADPQKGPLNEALLLEMTANRDALPQLQQLLHFLYQKAAASGSTVLTHDLWQKYDLPGRLVCLADKLPEIDAAFEAVFSHLVALPDEKDSMPVRRTVDRARVEDAHPQAPALIAGLIRQRLVTVWGDPRNEKRALLAVTHQSLFSAWPRLKSLIEKEGAVFRLRTRAADAAKIWRQENNKTSYLWWYGKPLRDASRLVSQHPAILSHEELEFATSSKKAGALAKGLAAVAAILLVLTAAAYFVSLGDLKEETLRQEIIQTAKDRLQILLSKMPDSVGQEARGENISHADSSDSLTLKTAADELLKLASADAMGLEARSTALLAGKDWAPLPAAALAWRVNDPASTWLSLVLEGDALWLQKKAAEARVTWMKADKLHPASVEVSSRLALAAESKKQWGEAVTHLSVWLTANDNAEARRRRAEAALNLRNYKSAVVDMKAARVINRADPRIRDRWPFFENLERQIPALIPLGQKFSGSPGDISVAIPYALALLDAGLEAEAREVALRQWPDSPRITALRQLFEPPLSTRSTSSRAHLGRETDQKLLAH